MVGIQVDRLKGFRGEGVLSGLIRALRGNFLPSAFSLNP